MNAQGVERPTTRESTVPAVVHVDLDGAADIFRVHGWRYPSSYSDEDPLFDRGLPELLDFLDEAEVRATLFVIARVVESPIGRERLREAVERGHELASHTVTHRPLTTLTSAEKRSEIFDSRSRIADALGTAVSGFRAPDLVIDREVLELVAEAGYAWDSSLTPSARRARSLGLDAIETRPHRVFASAGLVELPMPTHSPLPLPFHPSYSLVLGIPYFRLGLRRFRRTKAPLVLLFHLTDVADPLPRSLTPTFRTRLFTLSYLSGKEKRRRCARMLDAVRSVYTVTSTARIVDGIGSAA